MSQFDAVYDDRTVISGSTAADFAAIPDAGLLFVIVMFNDGSVEKYIGADTYEYLGETKSGSLTTDENFRSIHDDLPYLSYLLDPSKHVSPWQVLIDVSDINPATLLAALFNGANQRSIGELPYDRTETMDFGTAQAILGKTTFRDTGEYFHSIRGRYLRINITGHFIDPTTYDQRYGVGSLQNVVDVIRTGP